MKNAAMVVIRGATQLLSAVMFGGFAITFMLEAWANAKQWERDERRQ